MESRPGNRARPRPWIIARAWIAVLLFAVVVGRATLAQDPGAADLARQLKDKEIAVRLAAVSTLAVSTAEHAERLLLTALDDRDWEVVENAAVALAKRGGAASVEPLAELALEGPVLRVRVQALRSLAALDATRGAELLLERVRSKEFGARALDGLALLGSRARSDDLVKAVSRELRSDERERRVAAARTLAAFPPADAAARMQKLMYDEDLAVAAAALSVPLREPDTVYLPVLVAGLSGTDVSDILERRMIAGVRSILASAPDADRARGLVEEALGSVPRAATPASAARLARMVGALSEAPPPGPAGDDGEKEDESPAAIVDATTAMKALGPLLSHDDAKVRAAAVHALCGTRAEEALARARGLAKDDPDPHVRMHALLAIRSVHDARDEATFTLALNRLRHDGDPLVREEAAVALGVAGVKGAAPSLAEAVEESAKSPEALWALGTCAAVSLGKTRDPAALPALLEVPGKTKDWRLVAAAVVGLGHLQNVDAVPHLIEALSSRHPVIGNTAYEFLRRLTTTPVPKKVDAWREWWKLNGPTYVFEDREELARKAQKYGYAVDRRGVYEGLDVVVLQSRGDSIEKLLERLEIEHRLTRQGQVPDCGLHPYALFVSNCTGEVSGDDVEQLRWFVRAGGYLFGSCWALNHTVEHVYPGLEGRERVVRKLPTTQTVLANVAAEACPTSSPYIEGVFDDMVRPIYVLYGAHLIEVLDPERVEVLIDSPDCATTFGGGNLAAWFPAGHGVILDSANHFDLQGLEKAEGPKSAEDRMAYAIDHMGLSYEDVRELDRQKVWGSKSKSNKAAKDLSAFRFITNFVRHKRKHDL